MVNFCIFTAIIFIILVINSKILKYCWTTTMSIAVGSTTKLRDDLTFELFKLHSVRVRNITSKFTIARTKTDISVLATA